MAYHFITKSACVSGLWISYVFVFPNFFPFLGDIGNLEEAGDGEVSGKVLAPGEYIFVVQSTFSTHHTSSCSATVKIRSFLTLHRDPGGVPRGENHKSEPLRRLQPPGNFPSSPSPCSTFHLQRLIRFTASVLPLFDDPSWFQASRSQLWPFFMLGECMQVGRGAERKGEKKNPKQALHLSAQSLMQG